MSVSPFEQRQANGWCGMPQCRLRGTRRVNGHMWCWRHALGVWWRTSWRARLRWIRAGCPRDWPVVIHPGTLLLDADPSKCVISGWHIDTNFMTRKIDTDTLFWWLVRRYPDRVAHNT